MTNPWIERVKNLMLRARGVGDTRLFAKTRPDSTEKFWDQNITIRVASTFLLLSLVTVGIVGGVAFVKAREALKQSAFNQLSVSATLKEEEISRWFEDQQRDFFLITRFPDIQKNLQSLLARSSEQEAEAAHTFLANYLREIIQIKPNLTEVFVIDRRNRIVVSTNPNRENQHVVLASVTYLYLQQIKPGDSFNPIFYVSRTTGKPEVTLAAPLYDEKGDRKGAILAQLNLDQIDQIIRERTGLGRSGETYLIGSLVNEFTFISREASVERRFASSVSSPGIDTAMQGNSGSGLYKNYAGVPVIGVYRWLNDQDLALLVEMQQEEAFDPARQLAGTIILVGLVSVAGLALGVRWLTRQLQLSREQLEQYSHQLERKAYEASAANRSKSEFLANMSHELRTPLNAILGFTQLMTHDQSISPTHLEQAQIINRSGEHLLTLINDVLEMSKIESGHTTLSEEDFNLGQLLAAIEEMFQLRAKHKGLRLTFEHASNVYEYVRTDEGKLRQVLINLISNAIKFTEKGHVVVRVWRSPISFSTEPLIHTLQFEIEDSGPGILPAEQEHLFEPFVQTEAGRKSKQGTGLGLPISQKFVQLMGGEMRVSSVPGHGSLFAFTIQVQPSDLPIIAESRSPATLIGLAPNQPQYRILIVEDQWENRQLLLRLLTPIGFTVYEAENGEEAIAQWQLWHPHLIWMDMRMPVMDGYEATRRIRALEQGDREAGEQENGETGVEGGMGGWVDTTSTFSPIYPSPHPSTHLPTHPPTKILALTASAFEENRFTILAAGCDDFVRKPFQQEDIFDKMAEHLGVQYQYGEATESCQQPEQLSHTAPITIEAGRPLNLAIMPAEWIEQLHQAATKVNAKQIKQLIQQIPSEHADVIHELTHLIEELKFEEIVGLIQSK